jgi:hypothetical protein
MIIPQFFNQNQLSFAKILKILIHFFANTSFQLLWHEKRSASLWQTALSLKKYILKSQRIIPQITIV